MLRDVFLIAQHPLLGEEGKIPHSTISATALSAVAMLLRRSAAGNARSCIVGQQAMKPARLGKPKCDISCGLNVG
jgi:hypothetical protein